jgi:hypothetical protein
MGKFHLAEEMTLLDRKFILYVPRETLRNSPHAFLDMIPYFTLTSHPEIIFSFSSPAPFATMPKATQRPLDPRLESFTICDFSSSLAHTNIIRVFGKPSSSGTDTFLCLHTPYPSSSRNPPFSLHIPKSYNSS